MKDYTEQEIRAMRDIVYGSKITDEGWEKCKTNWESTPETLWLEREVAKIRK